MPLMSALAVLFTSLFGVQPCPATVGWKKTWKTVSVRPVAMVSPAGVFSDPNDSSPGFCQCCEKQGTRVKENNYMSRSCVYNLVM